MSKNCAATCTSCAGCAMNKMTFSSSMGSSTLYHGTVRLIGAKPEAKLAGDTRQGGPLPHQFCLRAEDEVFTSLAVSVRMNRYSFLRMMRMHITRRFTREGQDCYAGIKFVPRTSRIVNPDGSVVFEMKNLQAPESWTQVAVDILAQKYFRKAGIGKTLELVAEPGVPAWLQRSRPATGRSVHGPGDRFPPGLSPAGRLLDLLGLEGRLLLHRGRRPRLLRRNLLHAGQSDGRAEQSAVVQHRPALGLWHRRAAAGALLRRSADRQDDARDLGLRTPGAARLLHPVDQRRPGQRRRHHGPVGPRGPHLQVRQRHRLAISPTCAAKANRSPAAANRRA